MVILLALELGKFPQEIEQMPVNDYMDLLAEKHLQANPEKPKAKTASEFKASMAHMVKNKDG